MKTALLFPGQGSQYIGMGRDFYEKYQSSKHIFEALDSILNRNLSKLIFNGNIEELSQTENSQPAIMTTSIAIFKALQDEKILSYDSFHAVAGHSLGEYSALVVNDSISFEDSVKLLKVRSRAMQESMPIGTGGMLALIGCDDQVITKVMNDASKYGKIFIANDNANGQIVLSGEINSIEFILNNTKHLNIRRAIRLPVSAPFHCELMKNASDVMEKELKNINFNKFSVPIYSNVTSKICNEIDILDLLVKQVVSKVRWREIIENLIVDGFQRFIEIGPGNVLTNLLKRANKNVDAYSISKLEDFNKLSNI